MRIHAIVAAACTAAVLGCSAAAQSSAPDPVPGALRARALDGADHGLVYHLERLGAMSLPAVVLKTPGPAPFLEWRILRSGEAYPCPTAHELPGCTGASAITDVAPGFACVGEDGHAWLPDVGAAPAPFAFQSTRAVTFDGTKLVVTCSDGAGTLPAALPLTDAGPSRTIGSRLRLEPAD